MADVITFVPDKSLTTLKVGDVVKVTISKNGVPITGGDIKWGQRDPAHLKCDPLVGSTVPGQVQQFTAISAGSSDIFCDYNGEFSAIQHVIVASVITPPPPPPPPPLSAPALRWPLLRGDVCTLHTDFNYNWDEPWDWNGTDPSPMELTYATRYDVSISGHANRQRRLKKANPNIRCIPYALLLSTLTNHGGAPNPSTVYCNDFDAWNASHGVSAADAEKGWLHYPGFTDAAHRVTKNVTPSSPRFYPDPTNANMRAYQVFRIKNLCAAAYQDGVFLDEYGSNMNRADYALSCTLNGVTDNVRLQALCDAQTTLLADISAAIYPKQLIINTARYIFTWDAQETRAARGTHMEQANDPMALDWWNSVWPYIDTRLSEGDFVNIVTLREFGGYESVADALGNHMDSARGKALELAGYYCCVTATPQQLALSFENGNWATVSPTKNWLPVLDHRFGAPLEARQYQSTAHYFTRRFAHGLVVVHPVWNRNAPNYGPAGAVTVTLPTDRVYRRIHDDGTVDSIPTTTISLRCPEAAFFVTA